MSYELSIVTDVEIEPISLDEIKAFLRIDSDYTEEDGLLQLIASSARERLEKFTGISFAPKVLELRWNGVFRELPYGPVNAIISFLDNDGVVVPEADYTLSSSNFPTLGIGGNVNFFYPINGGAPIVDSYNGYYSTYVVQYSVGYEIGKLPKSLKQALLIQVDNDYKTRGTDAEEARLSELAKNIAYPYSRNLAL